MKCTLLFFLHVDDGYGSEYTLWDKKSTTMCECDPGYTGPHCAYRMCPKGDDPVTINQQARRIDVSGGVLCSGGGGGGGGGGGSGSGSGSGGGRRLFGFEEPPS